MYAVIAKFTDGSFDLIGFVNTTEEVDMEIDRYVTLRGADFLWSKGVRFNVELAA